LLFPLNNKTNSFSDDLKDEKEYSSRVISLLATFLFVIYTIMDCFGLPKETLTAIIPVRIIAISIFLGFYFITYKPIFQKQYNKINLCAYYAGGVAVAIGAYIAQPGDYSYNMYFAAFIILFIACFSWSYLPIYQSVFMSFVFVTVYSCIKIFSHGTTSGTELLSFLSHLFYMSSVIVLAAIAQQIRDSLIYRNLTLQEELKIIVDEKTEEAKKHKELAAIDELTGLHNRRFITEKLRQSIADLKETDSSFILAYIDLNGFKLVNDKYGHDAGDAVLIITAERLKRLIRENDHVARLGGDEFLLGFEMKADNDQFIEKLNKKIRDIIAAPIAFEGNILRVGVSVGYAKYPDDGNGLEDLIKVADKAMYQDKQCAATSFNRD